MELPVDLKSHPELCRRLQEAGQPKGGVGGDTALPQTISLRQFREIPKRRAASTCPSPRAFRYSSSRISPGGIAGPSQLEFLVIVFDEDFVGIAALPSRNRSAVVSSLND
jgi:hypothetical protein